MLREKIKIWYGKYERPISSLSLIAGFVFDAVTLKRVDLFWENFWVIAHIIIVGTCIVLINAVEVRVEQGDDLGAEALAKAAANPSKLHFWLVNVQQFFYGGIWSTFLVFYFRSSDILAGWPFLLILALSFWANEALKRHFVRLIFQISLFYLSIFSFAIFLVPVLMHKIGTAVFIIAGISSLVFISLYLLLIWRVSGRKFKENKYILYSCVAAIFMLVNVLYFTNLIPPIPLSLKDAGVYYSLQRNSDGNYVSVGELEPWYNYFKLYPDFHYLPGQPVFVYTAVFAPNNLDTTVVHQWQKVDSTGKWVTVNEVNLKLVGGRDGGFRTFTEKTVGLTPGHWRVNVLTTQGQVIGSVRFNLIAADSLPKVLEKINE